MIATQHQASLLHDPLAESRRRLIEGYRVDPTLGRQAGEGDGDADPQIVGQPPGRPVAGGRQEGDVEIAVRPGGAASVRADDAEHRDAGDLLGGFSDVLQQCLVQPMSIPETSTA